MRKLNLEFLAFLANFINYIIFAFVSINLIGTRCFNQGQMLITAFGLVASISVQLISMIIKRG